MPQRLVCLCNQVEKKEIISTLKKGASSAADIQKYTRAGTSCGRCLPDIDRIVEDFQKEKPEDQQQKLDFGF